MGLLRQYIVPRLLQFAVVVLVGVTVAFVAPRFGPVDPVVSVLNRVTAYGSMYMDPKAIEKLRASMIELYGLQGSLWEQYLGFWKRVLSGDFGPSIIMFPTPVIQVIRTSLPWTLGLLSVAAVLSWLAGNMLGGIAGYFHQRRWSRILEIGAMTVYPIPYYIMALLLLILFAYVFPWLPLGGAYGVGMSPSLDLQFVGTVLRHAALPALALVIVGAGWWFLSMRSLTSGITSEDYVQYAEMMGIPRRKVLFFYVMRNSLLPQFTNLALQLGGLFSGSLVTETVFSYPGLGFVLYTAVNNGDFSLMMGIVTLSVVGIALAALLIDLLYPLIDPRVRYR